MPKKKAESQEELRTGVIYCGDNWEVMQRLPEESIDLIYIDPPFFSNRHYEVIWGNGAELRAFGDRWKGGINVYVQWMKERLIEMHRLLKPIGSIYVHLDWHAVHYIKCEMDDIFGMGNFLNEIIWAYTPGGVSKKWFGRKHDNILVYCKTFSKHYISLPKQKSYTKTLLEPHTPSGLRLGIKRDDVCELCKRGSPGQKYRMVSMRDVWTDVRSLFRNDAEKIGYPTQKPERLVKRIITASCPNSGVVADFFMGGGTTLAVAERLGRRWIGCDVSPIACRDTRRRVKKLIKEERDVEIIGMPHGLDELKAMDPFEFQN